MSFGTTPIYQACRQSQQSDRIEPLASSFFLNLHILETKYIKRRYGRHSKQTELELHSIIAQLAVYYTDCIDYFSSNSENVEVYYQAKLKDLNKYYQLLMHTAIETQLLGSTKDKEEAETIQDLGSISSQTKIEMLIQERQEKQHGRETFSHLSKDLFNQNVMLSLQSQNIDKHFKENMKKREKVHLTVNSNLQTQMDKVEHRIRSRQIKMAQKKVSQSFSEHSSFLTDLKATLNQYQEGQAIEQFDINALDQDIDSPEKLKQLIESKIGLDLTVIQQNDTE